MDLGLRGRACVVTGGSRGIGLVVARRLREEGAEVLLVGRGRGALERATEACPGAESLGLDVTVPDTGARVLDACRDRFGLGRGRRRAGDHLTRAER